MAVDRLTDVMNYYYLNYIMVYCLAAVVAAACILAFKKRQYAKFSLVFPTIAGIGLVGNLLFTGVLADNNASNYRFWWIHSLIISAACLGLWVVPLVLAVKKGK